MSLAQQVRDTLFGGRQDPLNTVLTNVIGVATSPNGVQSAPIGTLWIMGDTGTAASDDDVYINTDGSTTWVLVYDASSLGHI